MRAFVLLPLIAACAPDYEVAPDDEVVDTDPDPVAADTGDTAVEDAPEELVPFYETSCPADPGWDASDPCGDVEGCDLVVFRISCALVRGRYPIAVAVRTDAGWVPLHDLAERDPGPLFAALVEAADLPDDVSLPTSVVDEERCSRADPELPEGFEFTPHGVYTSVAHRDHVACARLDAPGVYGPVGYVQMPIQEACVDELGLQPGWEVVEEPSGGHALRTSTFGLERVYAGFLADL